MRNDPGVDVGETVHTFAEFVLAVAVAGGAVMLPAVLVALVV